MGEKRAVFLAVLAVFFAGGFAAGWSGRGIYDSRSATDFDSPIGEVRVARIVDGDTVEINGGRKIRLEGIDTPESVDRLRGEECFGKEASRRLAEFLMEKEVRLERDVQDKDKYGKRYVRYVWLGEEMVNLRLVREGYAEARVWPPNVKYKEKFRVAQKEAREARRGLWGSCPEKTNKRK